MVPSLTHAQLGKATRRRQRVQHRDDLYRLTGKIAAMLGETERSPRGQIKLLLLALGQAVVIGLLRETLQIEQSGGMPTTDGSKRRTPGGVFFALARQHYGREYRVFLRAQRRQRLAKNATVKVRS